ncbi:MAG TPA: 4Fe-4S dicluster domain-containing protein [Anaerolineales bacterium]|nr:4Fe-4S dicluster domain-containing protein [Anaerolineales bacterium]
MTEAKFSRRTFLKVAAVATAAVAGFKVAQNVTAAEPVANGSRQWAMVIDQNKCTGCGYCIMACRAHNDVPPDITWNPVLDAGQVGGQEVFLPRPCMQCADAPCVEVCPVGASYYRSDGIVMMDYDRCIGCRYCEVACPYRARSFNWKQFTGPNPAVPQWGEPEVPRRPRGVPEKCAFCYERIDRGLKLGLTPGVDQDATPACVSICPTKARIFGDVNDPNSNVSQLLDQHATYRLRENLGTKPHVYYIPAEASTMEEGS